jgi:hypothetical protein
MTNQAHIRPSNKGAAPNAGGRRLLTIRTPRAARVGGRWAAKAMQHPARLLLILFLLAPLVAHAKHVAPPKIQSIMNNGVRYVVPNDKGLRAYVEAWDVRTGRKLWAKTIFTRWYIPPFGTECMHYEYLASMTLVKDELVLTSQRGRTYSLDIHTRAVRRMKGKAPNKVTAANAGERFGFCLELAGLLESPARRG